MAEFFKYDPLTGVQEFFDYDEDTGVAYRHQRQDISPLLTAAAEARNTGVSDAKLKQDDFMCLYAVIPPVVQVELRNRGLNLYTRDQTELRKVLQVINSEYPYLKTTHKTHAV